MITGLSEAPDSAEFYELLADECADFEAYVDEIVRDTGLLTGVPAEVRRYFDLTAYADDLACDYTVLNTGYGTVWVYRIV